MGRLYRRVPGGFVERIPAGYIEGMATLIGVQTGKDYIAAKRLVRFLMHTREMCITIIPEQGRDWEASSASDSDWAGCMASRRPTSGALVRLMGAVVSAVCRNQTVLAMSSSEAEVYACCVALAEAK